MSRSCLKFYGFVLFSLALVLSLSQRSAVADLDRVQEAGLREAIAKKYNVDPVSLVHVKEAAQLKRLPAKGYWQPISTGRLLVLQTPVSVEAKTYYGNLPPGESGRLSTVGLSLVTHTGRTELENKLALRESISIVPNDGGIQLNLERKFLPVSFQKDILYSYSVDSILRPNGSTAPLSSVRGVDLILDQDERATFWKAIKVEPDYRLSQQIVPDQAIDWPAWASLADGDQKHPGFVTDPHDENRILRNLQVVGKEEKLVSAYETQFTPYEVELARKSTKRGEKWRQRIEGEKEVQAAGHNMLTRVVTLGIVPRYNIEKRIVTPAKEFVTEFIAPKLSPVVPRIWLAKSNTLLILTFGDTDQSAMAFALDGSGGNLIQIDKTGRSYSKVFLEEIQTLSDTLDNFLSSKSIEPGEFAAAYQPLQDIFKGILSREAAFAQDPKRAAFLKDPRVIPIRNRNRFRAAILHAKNIAYGLGAPDKTEDQKKAEKIQRNLTEVDPLSPIGEDLALARRRPYVEGVLARMDYVNQTWFNFRGVIPEIAGKDLSVAAQSLNEVAVSAVREYSRTQAQPQPNDQRQTIELISTQTKIEFFTTIANLTSKIQALSNSSGDAADPTITQSDELVQFVRNNEAILAATQGDKQISVEDRVVLMTQLQMLHERLEGSSKPESNPVSK